MKYETSAYTMKNSVNRAIFVALSVLLQVSWIVILAMKLTSYYAAISTVTSLIALLVVLRIYGKHMNSAFKISWIILILVFPVFGLCLYVLFGREESNLIMRRRFDKAHDYMDGFLPQDPDTAQALKEENRRVFNQTFYLQKQCGYPVYSDTDIAFYGDTTAALEALKDGLRQAEKFIFMEYHAIEDSVAWKGIEDILKEKAAAGVDVRVIYDDMGSIGFLSKPFASRLEAEGIQCRIFNPLLPMLHIFMNNRDHRKITVVDGKIGFTGGYNLADEYFNLTHPYGEWKDSGLRLTGAAVRSLTVTFMEMWNAIQKTPEDPSPFLPELDYTSSEPAFVQPYADSPMDHETTGENVYLNMIKYAQEYIYITTPYLIIDDEMQRELILAAGRGVDVRIVTPGIPDKKLIYSVTRSYYAGLTSKGIRIYEYTPGFLHAKQMVCDGEIAAVGTINLDYRSLYLHFENGCLFYGCQAVADVRKDFDEIMSVSTEVTEQYNGKRNPALRGLQCVLRLFSPLM